MKKTSIAIATLALMLAFGCKNKSENAGYNTPSKDQNNTSVAQTSEPSTNLTPEQLGELGAKIKKHPKDAQKLLSDSGLTEQQFAQAIRKVAEDPDASKRYAAAYKKAS